MYVEGYEMEIVGVIALVVVGLGALAFGALYLYAKAMGMQ
jgi:hypothetical protein